MFVADAGIALWIAGLLLLGLLGFVVMVVALLFRFIGWILRALLGGAADRHRGDQAPGGAHRRTLCPHPGCGYTNGPTALTAAAVDARCVGRTM